VRGRRCRLLERRMGGERSLAVQREEEVYWELG